MPCCGQKSALSRDSTKDEALPEKRPSGVHGRPPTLSAVASTMAGYGFGAWIFGTSPFSLDILIASGAYLLYVYWAQYKISSLLPSFLASTSLYLASTLIFALSLGAWSPAVLVVGFVAPYIMSLAHTVLVNVLDVFGLGYL